MKKIINIFVISTAVSVVAWSPFVFAAKTQHVTLCPSVSEIKKNKAKGNWVAHTKEGLWKSYDMSFATNLTKFVGAQWTGEKVGQVTCVYESEQRFKMQGVPQIQPTIPVTLAYGSLTFQPSSGSWKHIKAGVYNCYNTQQKNCPFVIRMKAGVGDIYDQAESLKSDANSDTLQQPTY